MKYIKQNYLKLLLILIILFVIFNELFVRFKTVQPIPPVTYLTSPVKLGEIISESRITNRIDYDKLTTSGKKAYKNELLFMPDSHWFYLDSTQNTLVAVNKDNKVGIVKVHYSFEKDDILTKYIDSYKHSYPNYIISNENETIKITITDRLKPVVNYSTLHNYYSSLLNSLKYELEFKRYSSTSKNLYIEVDFSTKTSIETYIDLSVAPQFPSSVVSNEEESIKDLISDLENTMANLNMFELHSILVMKWKMSSNEIFVL